MVAPMTPDELHELTAAYHAFGAHRTGTPPDLATTDWFFDLLADRGATLGRRRIDFDRYAVETALVDPAGDHIPCDAVYYEFAGRFEGGGLDVVTVPARGAGNASAFDAMLVERDHPLAIVIENGPPGLVVMPNRAVADGSRPPAIVVPSDAGPRLPGATLTIEARLVPGRCESSSAVLGSGPPVTVTTPLSGWYGCASERGSGAAIALDLTSRLAETHTVTVVACSGHELAHLGLDAWLSDAAAERRVPAGPVIHLGASVGAARGGRLEPRIVLQGRDAPADRTDALTSAVTPANYSLLTVDDPWPGEGHNWREHTPHVLSFTGAGTWFHTVGDTPEQATSAAALGRARDAVWDATRIFLDHVG